MREKIIAGNWKMYKTNPEAVEVASDLVKRLSDFDFSKGKVVMCPPFTALGEVYAVIKESPLLLGGQDMFWENEGAYTGEISGKMLLTLGAKFVIIGHSERRTFFSETSFSVNQKVKAAVKIGLTPIICVGENLQEREKDRTQEIVEEHIKGAFKDVPLAEAERCVIAYEPVWAIGTGKNATSKQASEVHVFIRKLLSGLYGEESGEKISILYGGSVKPENAKELLAENQIDGALVGGASLEAVSFEKIVRSINRSN